MQAPVKQYDVVYRVPSKLDRCVLQSCAGCMSLLLVEPNPGMELKRFIFLRSLLLTTAVLWLYEGTSDVGDALGLSEELWELWEDPVVLGVWYTYSPST